MGRSTSSTLNTFIRKRDEASFRTLYRAHTPVLFAMAVRLCGSRSEAEELTQEAWVRAVERLDQFRGQSPFRTWLCGILANCHREALRRKLRQDDRPGNLDGAAAQVIEAFPSTDLPQADPEDLEQALLSLADGYREVVVLHDVYGHTHEEIAHLLGIRPGTSKSQLSRGRAQLRQLLTQSPPPEAECNGGAEP